MPTLSMLNPILHSLFTHNCVARHDSNDSIKCADDTTVPVVGLISNNDQVTNREKISLRAQWSEENNLSPNTSKPKEVVVDYS